MKISFSITWIKIVALISVLLISTHRADMTLDEVETTLQFEITTDSSAVKINPEGPLNFLRGYIYQKMDCMYNKRFFAPQINTDYLLKRDESMSADDEVYICTRDRQMDKAYAAPTGNKMDVYAEKYHNHLIELFPSPTGDITIETRGNQSFVQFLRAETTEKHALQILAMLLLFSEGVDIPIKVTNSVLEVYNSNKKDEIYFEVPMAIQWLNHATEKVETFQQKKVKQMIKFFEEYANNREVFSMLEDRCTKEEFMSGKFLDSPKFLIQSYIFGFIKSAEHATEFIQAAHEMTEKYAPKTEAPSKNDSVYDRLFMPASTVTDTECIALMKKTQGALNMLRAFPFEDSTQIPTHISVPRYNRKTNTFYTDKLEECSNCVDCMILSLFCCLAYDPTKEIYRTDHMGNVSESLKEFFAPKENKSFDTRKAEFQKEWCRIIAELDEPSIAYCKERNELECGIINMLLVIAEIVNISEDEKKKILGFEQSLKEKEGVLEKRLSNDIQEYTKMLLKRLSKTEIVELEFYNLRSAKNSNGRYDISGHIVISFKQNDTKNRIILEIFKVHCDIIGLKDDGMKKLNEIAGCCKNGSIFVENLFAAYVDYEARKLDGFQKNKEFMKVQLYKVIDNNFIDINRLLLVKKISDLTYKKSLIVCSILYSIHKNLYPNHPIIRFTSNILGSMELDNPNIQLRMFPYIICAGLLNKNSGSLSYPNINLSEKKYEYHKSNIRERMFGMYILNTNMDIFILWLKYCIDNFGLYNEKGVGELFRYPMAYDVYEYIFRDQNMEYANEVDEIIAREYPDKKDMIISDLHYVWFIRLVLEKNLNIELIKANFDAIQTPNCIPPNYRADCNQRIAQIITGLKEQLCTSEESIARFDKIIRRYNRKYSIITSRGSQAYILI